MDLTKCDDGASTGATIIEDQSTKTWSCDELSVLEVKSIVDAGIFEGEQTLHTDSIGLATNCHRVFGAYGDDRGKHYDYMTNDLCYTQPGIRCSSIADYEASSLYIDFPEAIRHKYLDLHGAGTQLDEPIGPMGGLLNGPIYAAMIKDFLDSDGYGGKLRLQSILALLLGDVFRTMDKQHDSQRISNLSKGVIANLTEYIDAHVDEKITLEQLADLANTSPFHFSREFKKSTGLSPHQFIIKHRIEKAKTMLVRKNLSLAEIAHDTGFSSQSHFTSSFRKMIGSSPGNYRQTIAGR